MPTAEADWIGVDWGTTHLRAWIFGPDGRTLAQPSSDDGMGGLARGAFEGALLALVGGYLSPDRPTPVICCGMAGARQGWVEAPYAAAPCAPPGLAEAQRVDTADPRLDMHILPGVAQARPADVMRGEETQIAGVLDRDPGFDGVVCLPGTHTKWVHVSAGEIVSFRTFMTGELFALLSRHSVLRIHVEDGDWDDAAFREAAAEAMARPDGLAPALIGLRAGALLDGLPPGSARARLSGLLIGVDLAGARPYWRDRPVTLVGAAALTGLYRTALADCRIAATQLDDAETTRRGLVAARRMPAGPAA